MCMLTKNLKLLFFLLFIAMIIFNFYFIGQIEKPDYFYCNEIVSYELEIFNKSFDFNYPKSCDEQLYHVGFKDFSNLIASDFNYAERPIYIIFIGIIYRFFLIVLSFSKISPFLILLFSNFIGQILLTLINVILFMNVFKKYITNNRHQYLVAFILIISPLVKWGIFDPSHQLLTLTAIIGGLYFKKNKHSINYKSALIFGTLMLLHRTFLIVFLWIVVSHIMKSFKLRKLLNYIPFLITALIPTLILTLVKYLTTGTAYDANTDYWGQFVWLFDFVRGKTRFESDWHCVSIPENFYCYFKDNLDLLIYLSVPFLCVILFIYKTRLLSSEDTDIRNLFSITLFLYLFWSFIGWYPPIRFSYYSLGNLIIILFIIFCLMIKDIKFLVIIISSYATYALYLNHWNDSDIVAIGPEIGLSYIFLIISLGYININKKELF